MRLKKPEGDCNNPEEDGDLSYSSGTRSRDMLVNQLESEFDGAWKLIGPGRGIA